MSVLIDNPRFAVASEGRVMAFVYRQSANMTVQDARLIDEMLAGRREPLLVACYTADVGAAPPTAAFRTAIGEVMFSRTNEVTALAMILPGSGFAHALRVSVHTGFMLIAKGPVFPNRIFRDLEGSLQWLRKWETVDDRMKDAFASLGYSNI